MSDKIKITLDDILGIKINEVEIPGVGMVKFRDPKTKERMEARRLAMDHPAWGDMNAIERREWTNKILVVLILEDPKITYEEFLDTNDRTIFAVIDVILMELWKKSKELSDKRLELVKDFLEQTKESSPLNTLVF